MCLLFGGIAVCPRVFQPPNDSTVFAYQFSETDLQLIASDSESPKVDMVFKQGVQRGQRRCSTAS